LARVDGQPLLEIADDGRGLSGAPGGTGQGLANMSARAGALHADLSFGPGLEAR
jgi:signal transduction histidine kinase